MYKNIKKSYIDQQHNTKFAPADENETSINSLSFRFSFTINNTFDIST